MKKIKDLLLQKLAKLIIKRENNLREGGEKMENLRENNHNNIERNPNRTINSGKEINREYIGYTIQGNRSEALKAIIKHVGPYNTKY